MGHLESENKNKNRNTKYNFLGVVYLNLNLIPFEPKSGGFLKGSSQSTLNVNSGNPILGIKTPFYDKHKSPQYWLFFDNFKQK